MFFCSVGVRYCDTEDCTELLVSIEGILGGGVGLEGGGVGLAGTGVGLGGL